MIQITGKVCGQITIQQNYVKVIVGKEGKIYLEKEFNNASLERVQEWILENSNIGFKNNRTIIVNEHDKKYLLVHLKEQYFFKCNIEHLPIIQDSTWILVNDKNLLTVRRKENKQKNQKAGTFQNIILPEFSQIIHIDNNRLNNCLDNLKGKQKKHAFQIEEQYVNKNTTSEILDNGQEEEYSEWFGGKQAGCTHFDNKGFQALVKINDENISKYFSIKNYGTIENAKSEAQKWLYELSLEHNLVKNKMRNVKDSNGDIYLQVQLQNNLIMKCDLQHQHFVEESIWTAHKGKGKKTFYARRRPSVKKNQEYIQFHNLICPEYTQVDHINQNGLDNRTFNLRDGKEKNPKNKSVQINNTSGVKGIFKEKDSWRAQIGIGNGKRKSQRFNISAYGSDIEAYKQAVRVRKQWEIEYDYN